jgi:hypothetical protein
MRSDARMLVEIPTKLVPIEDGHILFVVVNLREEGDVTYRRASSYWEMGRKLFAETGGGGKFECVQIGTLQPPGRWSMWTKGKTNQFTLKKFDKQRKKELAK